MSDLGREFMKQNYYYTYLKGRLEKARESRFEKGVLIAGSSHALCGINESIFGEAVNCSMHSQDIYYDCLCVRNVLDDLPDTCSFKTCILIMGYYIAFQDLSLSKYSRAAMIERTYYPIFHDAHNWEDPTIYDHWKFAPPLSSDEKIRYEKEALELSKKYPFYSDQTVQQKTMYDFGGRTWKELSDEEKDEFGRQRGDSHNYLEAHTDSYTENVGLLKDMVKYLEDRYVRMIVVVTPFTKEYRKYVSPTMKDACFRMMEEAKVTEILDFNDEKYANDFDEADFKDTDHLNEKGGDKLSDILAGMLQ